MPDSDFFCGRNTFFFGSRHCAAVLFLQVPKKYTLLLRWASYCMCASNARCDAFLYCLVLLMRIHSEVRELLSPLLFCELAAIVVSRVAVVVFRVGLDQNHSLFLKAGLYPNYLISSKQKSWYHKSLLNPEIPHCGIQDGSVGFREFGDSNVPQPTVGLPHFCLKFIGPPVKA